MKRVILGAPLEVDFSPPTELEEVVQNVRTIITTIVGTVPLDRDFGVDGTVVDSPLPAAKARLTADIVEKVQQYEPRAQVLQVTFQGDAEGRLIPRLEVNIDV